MCRRMSVALADATPGWAGRDGAGAQNCSGRAAARRVFDVLVRLFMAGWTAVANVGAPLLR